MGEVATFKTGKLDSNAAVKNGAYPFFTCSRDTFRTNTYSFDDEVVLLAGNNANGIYPLKYFKGKFDAYQRTYVIRPKDESRLDTRFLYFALKPQLDHLRSVSTGSATKFLTMGLLSDLEIPLPDLSTQHKIAGILSAYDDLIENNLRRIKILEEMAQSLYREWFVHFRFPGHESAKFVDSSLGLIPKGWEVKKLAEIAAVNAESIRATSAPDEIQYIDIASVSTGSIDNIEAMSFESAPSRARRVVRHGDIIWSTVRPNRRSFSLIIDPAENLIASTGFAVLSARAVPWSYLYQATTTEDFTNYLVNHTSGAAYPAVNSGSFENADVIGPPSDLLIRSNAMTEVNQVLQHNLHRRNQNLRRTRDLLLPKLLSSDQNLYGIR